MFQIRKFYDSDAATASAAPAMVATGKVTGIENTRFGNTPAPTPAPAAEEAAIPSTKTEEIKTQETAAAKSETPPAKTQEPAKTDTKVATTEKEKAAESAPKVEKITERAWQEVLKDQQPDAILKELGLDDSLVKFVQKNKGVDTKMLDFLDYWQTNGNVRDYLDALSVDYSKMDAEDVMRHQLLKENPELSKEDFAILYADRVLDRYKLDPEQYTDDEVRRGKVLLTADAKKVREGLIKDQQQYLIPKAPEQSPQAVIKQVLEDQKRDALDAEDAYKQVILNDPYTREFTKNKRLIFGEGDSKFSYEVADPENFMKVLTDSEAWTNAVFKQVEQDGKMNIVPDVPKQAFIAAAATDLDGLLNALSSHYKSVGADAATAPIENAKKPDSIPAKSEATPANAAAAMAKGGRIITR